MLIVWMGNRTNVSVTVVKMGKTCSLREVKVVQRKRLYKVGKGLQKTQRKRHLRWANE